MVKASIKLRKDRKVIVYLPEEVLKKIDKIVKERASSRSAVVREILMKALGE